jgi:3-oxoacyl-[acyl-carrier protein] reductase
LVLSIHHYQPHDVDQEWGADKITDLLAELRGFLATDAYLREMSIDLSRPHACDALIDAARSAFGHLDILVCNHANSGSDPLDDMTAEKLNQHWEVNVLSTLLLARAFASQHDGKRWWSRRVVNLRSRLGTDARRDRLRHVAGCSCRRNGVGR